MEISKKYLALLLLRGKIVCNSIPASIINNKRGIIAAAIMLTCCMTISNKGQTMTISTKGRAMTDNALTINPVSRYFGFYSVDLPEDFAYYGMTLFANGGDKTTKISAREQYFPPFKQFLTRREEELKNIIPLEREDSPYLKNIYSLPAKTNGIIFERMKNTHYPDSLRVLEGWKWDNMTTFGIEMEADDMRAARYSNRKSIRYNIPEKLTILRSILNGLTPRKDNAAPSNGRFALGRGQIDVTLLYENNRAGGDYELRMSYDNTKDVVLTVETDNIPYHRELFKENTRGMEGSYGKTLRKDSRNIGGIKADEWLFKENKNNDNEEKYNDYYFILSVKDSSPNFTGDTRLIMSYSDDVDPADKLSQSEMLTLWDTITATLKYYPPPQQSELYKGE